MSIKRQRERMKFPLGVSAEYIRRKLDPRYFHYEEKFIQLPGLNADYTLTTSSILNPLNLNIEALGVNMTTALATFTANGGCTITTATADNDDAFISSNLDAKQSALDDLLWNTAKEPYIHCLLVTGASITAADIFCGWRSSTPSGHATIAALLADPADQFGIYYSDEAATSTTSWATISSRTGVDISTLAYPDDDALTTGTPVAVSTLYRLEAYLDKDRKPLYFINGNQIATGDNTALTSVTTLKFYIGVAERVVTNAKAISVRNFMVSQLY